MKVFPELLTSVMTIIVFGKTKQEHDKNLHLVLQKLSDKNLTLNRRKCEIGKDQLQFFGFTFSKNGIAAQETKIKAIQNAETPKSPSEVRSLLGLANYCGRLIKDFASITAPLRALTHKNTKFHWTKEHEEALVALKSGLTNDALTYFDPKQTTELVVDASPVGLGAVLTQKENTGSQPKIIAYASRSLTSVERRYSQTEKEALAIVWGCEHFHLYLYGSQKPFILVTDHKPLELILQNPSSKPPARIERWNLRLQQYNFSITYRPGKDNPSDYLSRHPITTNTTYTSGLEAENHINLIASAAVPLALTNDDIINATKDDPTLQKVIQIIHNNHWRHAMSNPDQDVKPFISVRNELAVTDNNLLLKNDKIVVPENLQQQVINLAHAGHQGIVKTKKLIP